MTGGARKEGLEAGNVTSKNQALQGGAVTGHLHRWGVGSALAGGVCGVRGRGEETRSRCPSQKMEKCQHRKYLRYIFKWKR